MNKGVPSCKVESIGLPTSQTPLDLFNEVVEVLFNNCTMEKMNPQIHALIKCYINTTNRAMTKSKKYIHF